MTDQLIAAANLTSVLVLAIVGVILARYLWSRCRLKFWNDIFDITMAGAMIEAFSWAGHRGYWWVWRSYRANGDMESAKWLVDNGYFTLIFFAGIWVGAVMLIAPIMHYYFGRWWFCLSFAVVLATYGITLISYQ